MPKFIVDLWLDGYNSEEEMAEACEEFIEDQLNFTASSVKITRMNICKTCGRYKNICSKGDAYFCATEGHPDWIAPG